MIVGLWLEISQAIEGVIFQAEVMPNAAYKREGRCESRASLPRQESCVDD